MSNVSKSHTIVDLADKPPKLHFISVPRESAGHLELTHSLGHSLGQCPNYRTRIQDLKWIQGVWVESGGHLKQLKKKKIFILVVSTPTQQTVEG